MIPSGQSHESSHPDNPGCPGPANILEYRRDGSLGVLEVVGQDQRHHGAQPEVSEEDDGERENDGHRHHLLRVDHLLPHGGDHVEPNEAVEGCGRPADDPIQTVGSEASFSAPVVVLRLATADFLQNYYFEVRRECRVLQYFDKILPLVLH